MNAVRPTTAENAGDRLFARFFLLYFFFFLTLLFLGHRGVALPLPQGLALFQLLLIPLALLGGLVTVAKLYLTILCAAKALGDAAFFLRINRLVRAGAIGFWQWNTAFFLLAFSLLLFTLAASRACLFAFSSKERDLRLIFSKGFAAYLFRSFVLTALSVSLYFLFLRLELLLPA